MKKLFGEIELTWPKLIVFAVAAGLYTGLMALLPAAKDTSFQDIAISFEWWVLFGILIIMNSKTPLDSALKCFVFFLVSQPLVYLVQVPYNVYGWGIFRYYPGWFRRTLLTLPMGYIGWYMKKDNWLGLLILSPMLLFVGFHYMGFLRETRTFFPNHLLSALFCFATVILYPLCIFRNDKVRKAGLALSLVVLAGASVISFTSRKNYYTTTVMISGGSAGIEFDDTYTVSLADEEYGNVFIVYEEKIEDYMVNAEFRKTGKTQFIMESPEGERYVYDLEIGRDTYHLERVE